VRYLNGRRPALYLPTLVLLGVACSDQGFSRRNNQVDPNPSETDPASAVPSLTDSDTSSSEPTETATTRPCDVAVEPAGEVEVDRTCRPPPPEIEDPWDLEIKWQWTDPNGYGSIVMPAIGNLSDDNEDGVIDDRDIPDIVIASFNVTPGLGAVNVLSGDGSGLLWTFAGIDGQGAVALGDVDGDDLPDVIAWAEGRRVVAIDHTGKQKWISPALSGIPIYPQPTIADLNGDGHFEVIMDRAVLSGDDGSLLFMLEEPAAPFRTPIVTDLDGDGFAEILLGNNVYGHDGAVLWSVPPTTGATCLAAVADLDGDGFGESAWVWGNKLHIMDHDGTLIRTIDLLPHTNLPGPPAIADFTGNGEVEIAVTMNTHIGLFQPDGTMLWSQTMKDISGVAGVSGYDIDGDGAYEVIFADEEAMRIYDGFTGAVLYENFSHNSATVWEYPTIADIDGDGSAEIVISSNGGEWTGVTVFGHVDNAWAKAGPVWPIHDFAVSNIGTDLKIPSPIPMPWRTHNVFRARPTIDEPAHDLTVSINDVCVTSCEDDATVRVAVQVANQGPADSPGVVRLQLLRIDGEDESLIAERETTTPVASGASLPSIVFTLERQDIGTDGLKVTAETRSTLLDISAECDLTNNEAHWDELDCP
jgi:hypothetical protein